VTTEGAAAHDEKRVAAVAAAELVQPGMSVGLGTGSTVAELLPPLARRGLDIRCFATSPQTMAEAQALGLRVDRFDGVVELDIAIDGADQVAPDFWLIKGGGAAHTREKIVAAAARQFVVIVDSSKLASTLTPPVPLELVPFGLAATLYRLAPVRLRDVPRSPDGGVIADYFGGVGDPAALARRLSDTPGVVEHGLFAPELVSTVLVGRGDRAERLERSGASPAPMRGGR
jgi:ribose 5-phosphate isomerase A